MSKNVTSADARALLDRFKPLLMYDSQEAFFADSAAEMTDNPGNTLRRAPRDGTTGAVLAAADRTDSVPRLTLDLLGAPGYAADEPVRSDDRLSIAGENYRAQYVRLRVSHPELRNHIYGRVKRDREDRLWLQYWFWYFYNDYHLAANFGLHEGDWEMVQLRMDGDAPDIAVYAQHRAAESMQKSRGTGIPNLFSRQDGVKAKVIADLRQTGLSFERLVEAAVQLDAHEVATTTGAMVLVNGTISIADSEAAAVAIEQESMTLVYNTRYAIEAVGESTAAN